MATELLPTAPLAAGGSLSLELVPGRSYEVPVPVPAGERLSIPTTSQAIWDSILVLLAPDGTPVVGSDDFQAYIAGLDWAAEETVTYRMRVTSFEAVNTGELVVKRD